MWKTQARGLASHLWVPLNRPRGTPEQGRQDRLLSVGTALFLGSASLSSAEKFPGFSGGRRRPHRTGRFHHRGERGDLSELELRMARLANPSESVSLCNVFFLLIKNISMFPDLEMFHKNA